MAVYIIYPYLTVDQRKVWLLLSKVCNIVLITLFSTFLWGGLQQVFRIIYCQPLLQGNIDEYRDICQNFVNELTMSYPEHGQRVNVHLLLHLAGNIMDFSHPSCYNTERFNFI